MPDAYRGNGYEFSIRSTDHRRLWVHVTRGALEVLNRGHTQAHQLAVMVKHMPLLHQLACQRHQQTGHERIVIGVAKLRGMAGIVVPRSDHGRPA